MYYKNFFFSLPRSVIHAIPPSTHWGTIPAVCKAPISLCESQVNAITRDSATKDIKVLNITENNNVTVVNKSKDSHRIILSDLS